MANDGWCLAGVLVGFAASACSGEPELATPPCADGGWGEIGDPAGALHVRADGDDLGSGTVDDPLATVGAALAIARDGGGARIAVGPGRFAATLDLGASADGLAIAGCSAGGDDATTLEPEVDSEPILSVTAAVGVELAGLTLDGGARSLFVWGGAEVSARQVTIFEPDWSGFVVDGPYTVLALDHVDVVNARAVSGVGGYGGEVDGGTLAWTSGAASGSTGAGLVASGSTASVSLTDVSIDGTAPSADGRFGRGVQVQDYASATLTGCALADNADAGVFALMPTSLTLDGVTIERTTAGAGGGDGVVVTGIDAEGHQLDPATFQADLVGNTVDGVARAGVLVERATARLDGNTVTGAAAGAERVAQEGAVVTGSDAVTVADVALTLERAPLASVGSP